MGITDTIDALTKVPEVDGDPTETITFAFWIQWAMSVCAQVVSAPIWVSSRKFDDFTLREIAEGVAWFSSIPLIILSKAKWMDSPRKITDAEMSLYMFVLGMVHTNAYLFLAVVEWNETDFDDSAQWPKVSYGMKVGQNFLTSLGEMTWGLRAAAVKVFRAPVPEGTSKAGAIATIAVWEVVAFGSPRPPQFDQNCAGHLPLEDASCHSIERLSLFN